MPWWAPAIERERERELAGGRGENGFRFLIGEGIGGAVPDGRSRTRTKLALWIVGQRDSAYLQLAVSAVSNMDGQSGTVLPLTFSLFWPSSIPN